MYCTYSEILSHVHATVIALEKAIIVAYSGFVFVALDIQHTNRMRRVFMCGLFGSAAIFSTFCHKRQDFRGKKLLNRKCFDILYSFCLNHFSLYEELSEISSTLYIGLKVKCPLFLSDFSETGFLSRNFR